MIEEIEKYLTLDEKDVYYQKKNKIIQAIISFEDFFDFCYNFRVRQ